MNRQHAPISLSALTFRLHTNARVPGDFDEVRHIFDKRGGYRKFRALLARRNAVDRWYEFESKATERALRDWCEFNSITVTIID